MSIEGFKGKGLICWELPPEPRALAEAAQGCDWLAFKVHDGASSWGESRNVTPSYVRALRSLYGGKVYGWGYVYCDGKTDAGDRGDGIPELEAAAATNAVRGLGLDGYAADAEIEWDTADRGAVGSFFDRLDEGWNGTVGGYPASPRDFPLGVFCWAAVDGHEGYPWQLVAQRADVLLPMAYGGAFNADSVLQVVKVAANLGKPVAPAVSLFATDGQAIAEEVAKWAWGVSAWEYRAVSASPWWRSFRLPQGVPVTPPPVPLTPLNPPSDPGKVAACRDVIFKAAGDLVNAGGPEGIAVQNVVRWAKGELDFSEATQRELGLK